MKKEVEKWLTQHRHFEEDKSGRIRCTITNALLPAALDSLNLYVAGRKFQAALEEHESNLMKHQLRSSSKTQLSKKRKFSFSQFLQSFTICRITLRKQKTLSLFEEKKKRKITNF